MKTLSIIILAVLIIVGVIFAIPALGSLAYFQVLEPDSMIPERCNTSPEFTCSDWIVRENQVVVELQNNAGRGVELQSATMESEGIVFGDCTVPGTLNSMDIGTVTCPIQSGSFTGVSEISGDITYQISGESLSRMATVDILHKG